ncbi:MAG: Hint domain-containing protein [Pseudomonadota bacterium]
MFDPTVSRSFSLVNSDGTLPYSDIVCFANGTRIKMQDGHDQFVEDLSVGDRVLTQSGEAHPIRWIGSRSLQTSELWSEPKNRPVRIRAGALGSGLPVADLLVSPQHRVLVRSLIAERMFGQFEVLIPAKSLVDMDGIGIAHDVQQITYFHLLFDAHQVIFSNGALTESLFTGPQAMKSITKAQREEIFRLFPDICAPGFASDPARFIPHRGRTIRTLLARHRKNNKPLVMAA